MKDWIRVYRVGERVHIVEYDGEYFAVMDSDSCCRVERSGEKHWKFSTPYSEDIPWHESCPPTIVGKSSLNSIELHTKKYI